MGLLISASVRGLLRVVARERHILGMEYMDAFDRRALLVHRGKIFVQFSSLSGGV